MVDFKTKVYYEDNDQVIGAEVIVYSEEGDRIGSIQITSKKDFDDLIDRINGFDDVFVGKSDLENLVSQLSIDAATLDGYSSPDFALRDHSHNLEYAITNHATSENRYGLGSDSVFGHVKIVNDLEESSYKDGHALSAYQGKVLNTLISNVVRSMYSWTRVVSTKISNTTVFEVFYNAGLKMCWARYARSDYVGFKTKYNQTITLHAANTVQDAYHPHARIISPIFHPDVNIWINTDGSVSCRSNSKIDSISLVGHFMWVV